MSSILQIECKILGRSRPLTADWSIGVPPEWISGGETLTLRDLITRVVREEVARFRQRQAERRLIQVLTEAQIREGAQKGKIAMGGSDLDQPVDPEVAVDAALQAFEDGFYYVFLDDEQQESLDSPVRLHEDSRLTFLRLVPLVGG